MTKMNIQQAMFTIKAETGFSNYRIAKLLGVQQIMINRYLNGEVKSPNANMCYRIYKTFDILIDTFENVEMLEAYYETL